MTFGVNAAPEKYQHIESQVLGGCDGVANISYDIVVYGEHDVRLSVVLDKFKEKKPTLNKDKCQFGVTENTFMGHELSQKGIQPTNGRIRALNEAERP